MSHGNILFGDLQHPGRFRPVGGFDLVIDDVELLNGQKVAAFCLCAFLLGQLHQMAFHVGLVDDIGDIVVYHDDVVDLALFQVQVLKDLKPGIAQLLHQALELGSGSVDPGDLFMEAQDAYADVLRSDQLAVVEKGKLDGTAAYIQDGRAGLDHLFKGTGPEGDGFVVQETLLRIPQDIYMDAGLVLDLAQDDGCTGQFPYGAGAVGLISLHPVVVHDPFELQHDLL